MWWILVWAVLLLATAALIALLGWRLFRQVLDLGREIGVSGGRVSDAMAQMRGPASVSAPSSVFLDPDSLTDLKSHSPGTRRRRA